MSQVWVERPSYYFWIANAPCAYFMGLESSFAEESNGERRIVGIYSLKAYPYRNTPLFFQFSKEEQLLLQSDYFDGTNTPKFERLEDIPSHYFTVGSIELAYSNGSSVECFEVIAETLDLITTLKTGGSNPGCLIPDQPSCGVLRAIQGWDITYRIFNTLVLVHSFHFRKKPAEIVLCESRGFHYVYDDRTEAVLGVDDETSSLMSISVNYCGQRSTSWDFAPRNKKETGEPGNVNLIIDGNARPEDFKRPQSGAFGKRDVINPLWWTIAQADFECELNTPCGCC